MLRIIAPLSMVVTLILFAITMNVTLNISQIEGQRGWHAKTESVEASENVRYPKRPLRRVIDTLKNVARAERRSPEADAVA